MRKIKLKLLQNTFRSICLIIIFLIIFNTNYVFSDLEDDEEIDINGIKEETIETYKKMNSDLELNSRIALIYDRLSRKNFI